jgi:hypothetical protein
MKNFIIEYNFISFMDIDYRKKFDLEETIEKSREIVEQNGEIFLPSLLSKLSFSHETDKYKIRKNDGLYSVYLGNGHFHEVVMDRDVLLLSVIEPEDQDLSILKYRVSTRGLTRWLLIDYVQSLSGIREHHVGRAKKLLGSDSKDFMIGHFLARIGPYLDKHPELNVGLNREVMPENLLRDYEENRVSFEMFPDFDPNQIKAEANVYRMLIDRYFTKQTGALNPNRTRVQQILGSDNNWITTRTS